MPVDVVLYGRPNCCLCDEAERMLSSLRSEFGFVLSKINIDDDPALTEKYGRQIPVITFNGRHRLALRVTPQRLRRSLQKAQTP